MESININTWWDMVMIWSKVSSSNRSMLLRGGGVFSLNLTNNLFSTFLNWADKFESWSTNPFIVTLDYHIFKNFRNKTLEKYFKDRWTIYEEKGKRRTWRCCSSSWHKSNKGNSDEKTRFITFWWDDNPTFSSSSSSPFFSSFSSDFDDDKVWFLW